jgi:hypothetical protein
MLGYGKTGVSVMMLPFPYFKMVVFRTVIFFLQKNRIFSIFAAAKQKGDLSEWFKEHAWKVCILQKGIKSSNLLVSARFEKRVLM